MIRKLLDEGVDVFRLNASHGSHEYMQELINNIRLEDETAAILLDTKGPEIRTGELSEPLHLEEGQHVSIGDGADIAIKYSGIASLEQGAKILIDDGLLELEIVDNKEGCHIAKVINGGTLTSKKTVTIPGHDAELPFLSEQDKQDILFGLSQDVDFIAASFVRSVDVIRAIKKMIKEKDAKARVLAKIEHRKAVEDIDNIIKESQGIMIARGDLGVEMPIEKVPGIQAQIIKQCAQYGRPVIVATQMLESMHEHPRPTRAEVADVANAILQGTDAVMLSGETAAGKYPVRAVRAMATIAKEYEDTIDITIEEGQYSDEYYARRSTSLFVTRAAALATKNLKTGAIITPTESGYTARKVSHFKPLAPIVAFSPHAHVLRQLRLSWGVTPRFQKEEYDNLDEMMTDCIKKSYDEGFVTQEDKVVITAGNKLSKSGLTNTVQIFRVSSIVNE